MATAAGVAGAAGADPARPRNRIQVSREKRPLNFFIGLAKKFLVNEEEVELSGLGLGMLHLGEWRDNVAGDTLELSLRKGGMWRGMG